MNCEKTLEQLHDAIDGLLAEDAQQAFTDHLADCDSCREEYAFMKNILAETAELPKNIQPDRDLWDDILAKLDVEAKPANVVTFPKQIKRWAPLVAVAALILVVASLQSFGPDTATDPVTKETTVAIANTPDEEIVALEAQYADARTTLMQALEARKQELPEDLVATIEENLNIIENAVVDINRALAENPENPELERMLHAAYQSEVSLLQAVVGVESDES
ncbi:MAG: zf-HC2 domain-containing protein [Candidatus Hydrogenedentota bacterium]